MVEIGNFFGNFLGYLLYFLFTLIPNYGVAIILFTVILKIAMFPFSVKQQKSMAASGKLQVKQKELQKKYGSDKAKYNEELQKLYEKEGVNPAGGCLPMLIPFPIMIGIYYTVIYPLTNALHVSQTAVDQAVAMLPKIPGMGFTTSQYGQLDIIKNLDALRSHLTMFSPGDMGKLNDFSHGFKFLGLDLLAIPKDSAFSTMLWLIPVLCLVSSLVSQYFMMKLQPGMQQQQQGCMKYMMYLMPLFSVWLAYTLPGAVGFYWIISTLTGFAQTLILNVWYSPADLTARAEAQRIALRVQEEEKIVALPLNVQNQLAAQSQARINSGAKNDSKNKKNNVSNQKQKSGNNSKGSSGDYMGSKK